MVRIKEVFLPVSGQPGPRREEMVKDQFGGRMRCGSVGAEARARARAVVRTVRRGRAGVVYFISEGVQN